MLIGACLGAAYTAVIYMLTRQAGPDVFWAVSLSVTLTAAVVCSWLSGTRR